ncbi:nitrate reductase [Xylariaceae sp. FL1019]|nr:nitrate reductase [Xylariaceae sp. FL1019]
MSSSDATYPGCLSVPQYVDSQTFPPSPPETDGDSADCSTEPSDTETGKSKSNAPPSRSKPHYPLPPKHRTDNVVLAEDLKTPDAHVVRDPRLIRLTGIHPFNVEAPLSELYDEGFLTSKDLHYVRNHGGVPNVDDSNMLDWEFTVEGMVDNPIQMKLADLLMGYEQYTYPVTLVCAGNRRKEQNVVRKTKGFSWGAAGLSTALWTGVPIGDVLRAAKPKRGARYVCFEGADKLPNGYYGTSIKLTWAMDPERGVMLAHKMNGETLPPDHGKPLRVVIPGQIGGRSVKWLKRIIITREPSDNWYHIYDNRVLPTTISPEMSADLPDVWKDERTAIYDLNTNSATCYPAHNEEISLNGTLTAYKVRGYAYAGGGKRVTRVEITLDKGQSWMLADVSYPEDDYRLVPEGETLFGGGLDISGRESCFCWCFWELDISLSELQAADDIMVRAMDESMMVQPRDMYWSVLGMMNNPWFRVVIHRDGDMLRFEHPTLPALKPGGWMERVKKDGGNLANGYWGEQLASETENVKVAEPVKEISMVNSSVNRIITLEELKLHESETEPWFVVNGEVYDGTGYLEGHPGGPTSITGAAGQDASEEFLAIHSENAKAMLANYHVGTLSATAKTELLDSEPSPQATSTRETFLDHKAWTKALLSSKKSVSPDTKIFTFELSHASQALGLPVGQHVMLRLRDPVTREALIRAYTPLSTPDIRGRVEILIKIYRDTGEQKGGAMTQALDSIPLGHFVEFKGPAGKFEYLSNGLCSISGKKRNVKRFVMICGGSGITPIYAVLRAVMKDNGGNVECIVLNGNRTEEDILCQAELDDLVKEKGHILRVKHTLSRPRDSWTGVRGRIDRDMIVKEIGESREPGAEDMVLVCGPKPLEESVRNIFTDLRWKEEDMIFF